VGGYCTDLHTQHAGWGGEGGSQERIFIKISTNRAFLCVFQPFKLRSFVLIKINTQSRCKHTTFKVFCTMMPKLGQMWRFNFDWLIDLIDWFIKHTIKCTAGLWCDSYCWILFKMAGGGAAGDQKLSPLPVKIYLNFFKFIILSYVFQKILQKQMFLIFLGSCVYTPPPHINFQFLTVSSSHFFIKFKILKKLLFNFFYRIIKFRKNVYFLMFSVWSYLSYKARYNNFKNIGQFWLC